MLRYTSLTVSTGATYSYDSNGNQLTKALAGGTITYTWNALNQLTGATVPSVGSESYIYDPFGRRVEKVSPSGTTVYAYDGSALLGTYTATGTPQQQFTPGPGTNSTLAVTQGSASSFYEQDALMSVTSLSSASGSIVDSNSYTAFGTPTTSGNVASQMLFAGMVYDKTTGLYYDNVRYYDPGLGRFISEDPSGMKGGINLYDYTGNDPSTLVDPTGLCGGPSGAPPPPDPNNAQQVTKECQQGFYNSGFGKAVNFMSLGSLVPGWGPDPTESAKEWILAIAGKGGGGKAIPSSSRTDRFMLFCRV